MSLLMCKADARAIPLPEASVQCVVTSPPYWGLRKYDGEQELEWEDWRGAYGLEPTVQMYVSHTVTILREIRRVLKPDGVVFWNIGDSYANNGGSGWQGKNGQRADRTFTAKGLPPHRSQGLKPKDLCLIPQRTAIAAQDDGWWVRSMIIWHKPNPMPESCRDRPTSSYEHIIMLTKSERYYWDFKAVQESVTGTSHARMSQDIANQVGSHRANGGSKSNGPMRAVVAGSTRKLAESGSGIRANKSFETSVCLPAETRNVRDVWKFPSQAYSEAHFATFPEELPRRCIKAASRVGDLVLDPFGGSGTTGRVAIQLQRRCVLLDLAYTASYGPLAKKRTTDVQLEAFA